MPKKVPSLKYAQETPENRANLEWAIDILLEWIKTQGPGEGRALLRAMGERATRQEWIAMYDDGEIGLGHVGDRLGFIWYDEDEGRYLPFGPVICKLRPDAERN